MNIVFSTTRQWNPGDEFILLGCINLLKKQLGEFNPIIFNRNPQIRRHRKFDLITALDDLLGKGGTALGPQAGPPAAGHDQCMEIAHLHFLE